MKYSHPFPSFKKPLASAVTASSLLVLGMAAPAEAATALFLAYGVDTQETLGENPNPNYNRIRVRDHHIDHYHNFSSNASSPLAIVPGSSTSITLGAMNYAPDSASQGRYFIPNDGAGSHIHLVLVSLTGPGGESLTVNYGHGSPTHTLLAGGDAHLEIDDPTDLFFSLGATAALGSYTAEFQLVDEGELYLDSPNFTLHFNAVPEPSSFLMAGSALVLGVLRRRR